jgi:hypothetical protein
MSISSLLAKDLTFQRLRLCLVSILNEPQRQVPGTIGPGDQQERGRAGEGKPLAASGLAHSVRLRDTRTVRPPRLRR